MKHAARRASRKVCRTVAVSAGLVRCDRLRMREANLSDRAQVREIMLGPDQERFAGSVDTVFDELEVSANSHFYHPFTIEYVLTTICTPIGFLVVREATARPHWAEKDTVTVHSVRVATAWQGKGVGRFAFGSVAQWVRLHRPSISKVMLAVNVRNRNAIRAYIAFGFRDTGMVCEGPIGNQVVLSLRI